MAVRFAPFVAVSLWIAFGFPMEEPTDVQVATLVTQVQRYAASWQARLLAIVAEEHYKQTRSVYRRTEWGGRGWERLETRQMESELLLLRAPSDGTWVAFRDVIAVDGQSVRDREQRFDALFGLPSDQLGGEP